MSLYKIQLLSSFLLFSLLIFSVLNTPMFRMHVRLTMLFLPRLKEGYHTSMSHGIQSSEVTDCHQEYRLFQ